MLLGCLDKTLSTGLGFCCPECREITCVGRGWWVQTVPQPQDVVPLAAMLCQEQRGHGAGRLNP